MSLSSGLMLPAEPKHHDDKDGSMAADTSTALIALIAIGLVAIGVATVTAKLAETDFALTLLVILVGFFFIVEKKKFRAWEKMQERAMEVSAALGQPPAPVSHPSGRFRKAAATSRIHQDRPLSPC